jgi:hypothetical protein
MISRDEFTGVCGGGGRKERKRGGKKYTPWEGATFMRYSNLSNNMMISELWTTITIQIQYVDG